MISKKLIFALAMSLIGISQSAHSDAFDAYVISNPGNDSIKLMLDSNNAGQLIVIAAFDKIECNVQEKIALVDSNIGILKKLIADPTSITVTNENQMDQKSAKKCREEISEVNTDLLRTYFLKLDSQIIILKESEAEHFQGLPRLQKIN